MAEVKKNIVTVSINDKEYVCSIAATSEAREYGLMYKGSMEENEGLLFIYPEIQEEIGFWMKDTPLHLDIIFICPCMEVISVKEGKPDDITPIFEKNVQFVLEVPYGSGIEEGDEVEIDGLEDALEKLLEDRASDSPKEYIERENDEIEEELKEVAKILDPKGKVQYIISGGERIFSRPNSKVLIRQAKKAEKLKTDSAYKTLGKSVFKYMKIQDENDPEYVTIKD